MKDARNFIIKKLLIVGATLLLGFLMPYISRIPNAFYYGTEFIWNYTDPTGSFWYWNGFHLESLVPMFIFGMIYTFANVRWAFYASALSHFAATWFFYHDHGVVHHPDDFLGFIVYPYVIGIPSFLCGIIGLISELIIQNRKSKQLTND